jgi:hypothetical protein
MCTEDVIVGMNEISNSTGNNRNKEIKLDWGPSEKAIQV